VNEVNNDSAVKSKHERKLCNCKAIVQLKLTCEATSVNEVNNVIHIYFFCSTNELGTKGV